MPKPTALVAPQAAAATTLEARRAESRDLHQMTTSQKNLLAAPHLTAQPHCRAQPMETWAAPPAWAPARLLPTAATLTAPVPRFFRGWSRPPGPAWGRLTQRWPSLLFRLRRFWRPGSRRTVWLGPLLESCLPSTENPTLPSRRTCSEAQRERKQETLCCLLEQWGISFRWESGLVHCNSEWPPLPWFSHNNYTVKLKVQRKSAVWLLSLTS